MAAQGMDWVWEVLKLALAPGMRAGADLPRVVYVEDLEHVGLKRWMCFGAALTVTDRYRQNLVVRNPTNGATARQQPHPDSWPTRHACDKSPAVDAQVYASGGPVRLRHAGARTAVPSCGIREARHQQHAGVGVGDTHDNGFVQCVRRKGARGFLLQRITLLLTPVKAQA